MRALKLLADIARGAALGSLLKHAQAAAKRLNRPRHGRLQKDPPMIQVATYWKTDGNWRYLEIPGLPDVIGWVQIDAIVSWMRWVHWAVVRFSGDEPTLTKFGKAESQAAAEAAVSEVMVGMMSGHAAIALVRRRMERGS